MNTAIVATTPTVSPYIQNLQQQRQQPQTSKEVIAANVKALIEQLEEGHSEGLTAYLMAMGRFHNYSFGNILEIARQPRRTRWTPMRLPSRSSMSLSPKPRQKPFQRSSRNLSRRS
jgi:hypothetical protein